MENKAPSEATTPSGLLYLENFITSNEQKELIEFIDAQEWDTSIARRTQHYGYRYNYKDKNANAYLGEIPEIFTPLREKLQMYFERLPDQVIVNEYYPKQGIAAHVDHVKFFGPVVASVSLLAPVEMEFTRGKDKFYQILQPTSALILDREARYKWSHQIKPKTHDTIEGVNVPRSRRVSITFRTMNA
jgi:alkylated DNA repair dioxygenase AlkB